jgi:ABC-type proline/glycine betaine transport system permease subunit
MTASMRTRDRAAAAFVLCVMGVGCLALFIGVPIAVLWSLSKLTDSFATHFVGGLLGIPLAIALLSPALFWLNGLYLRITSAHRDEKDWDDPDDPLFRVHGPLEPMLVATFVLALIAITVWFFFFAENPVLTT